MKRWITFFILFYINISSDCLSKQNYQFGIDENTYKSITSIAKDFHNDVYKTICPIANIEHKLCKNAKNLIPLTLQFNEKDFVKTDGHLKDMQTIASFYKELDNYNKYIEEYKKMTQNDKDLQLYAKIEAIKPKLSSRKNECFIRPDMIEIKEIRDLNDVCSAFFNCWHNNKRISNYALVTHAWNEELVCMKKSHDELYRWYYKRPIGKSLTETINDILGQKLAKVQQEKNLDWKITCEKEPKDDCQPEDTRPQCNCVPFLLEVLEKFVCPEAEQACQHNENFHSKNLRINKPDGQKDIYENIYIEDYIKNLSPEKQEEFFNLFN